MNYEKGNQKLGPGDLAKIVMKPGTEPIFKGSAKNNVNAFVTVTKLYTEGNYRYWCFKDSTKPLFDNFGLPALAIPEMVLVKITGPDINISETETTDKQLPVTV